MFGWDMQWQAQGCDYIITCHVVEGATVDSMDEACWCSPITTAWHTQMQLGSEPDRNQIGTGSEPDRNQIRTGSEPEQNRIDYIK